MKRRLKDLLILALAGGVLGVVLLVSGVFPVGASGGHWAITRWVLDFASDRSVAFHSQSLPDPPWDARAIRMAEWTDLDADQQGVVRLGAAIFRTNCRRCHGTPGRAVPPVAAAMTPTPPPLNEATEEKEATELFYIVDHGIRFAGMPAWPVRHRDEEIWPVIAFLSRLNATTRADFDRWVRPGPPVSDTDPPTPTQRLVARRCAACHGIQGSDVVADLVPVLAGQSSDYLKQTLLAYRERQRISGIMQPVAYSLTDQQIEQLADFFAGQSQAVKPRAESIDPEQIARGRQLAESGSQADKIPSCIDCHGPGNQDRNEEYPRLAGQPINYLITQLRLFRERHRGGPKQARLMHEIADQLSASQRQDVAAFYSAVPIDSGTE